MGRPGCGSWGHKVRHNWVTNWTELKDMKPWEVWELAPSICHLFFICVAKHLKQILYINYTSIKKNSWQKDVDRSRLCWDHLHPLIREGNIILNWKMKRFWGRWSHSLPFLQKALCFQYKLAPYTVREVSLCQATEEFVKFLPYTIVFLLRWMKICCFHC